MRLYAVLDTKTNWVLAVRGRRDLAEARLRALINGAIAGGGTKALAPWLPPGTGAQGMVPNLVVVRVDSTAKAGCKYAGKVYERRSRLPTKKSA
jgi:hypothetical protein